MKSRKQRKPNKDGIITVGVAFNVQDCPDQLLLYEHVMKRSNYSAYIKRLIQRDIDGVAPHYAAAAPEPEIEIDTSLMGALV
jgi:hypothetical protein